MSKNYVSELEEIRLRNLQTSRAILGRKSHWTDDEITAMMIKLTEDMRTIAFVCKRLIDRFSD